ncbi:SUN domain-containing ossification factor isoform X4 [Hyposmocoma kahamanoa]|uniref:SUN domain-containing ossification factor isoform X4 n=1 Tax=Hyposmocoma kahamanoa TaxID=1477025 RepID=UPI000E6D899E|nr:SUN domain-containing ossification factor isoform X4 [Hyposmocoma kahamanoa]
MKGGLCIIYTSLLTISVLSSCALFLLVVSEALQADTDIANVDLSGLHNVSHKVKSVSENVPKSSPEPKKIDPVEETPPDREHEMTFTETLSLNSVTTDGLPDTGQPPILISLGDNAKLDLKNPDELVQQLNHSEQHNDTKILIIRKSNDSEEDNKEKDPSEPRLIVKAKPMQEPRQMEDAFLTPPPLDTESTTESQEELKQENIPTKPDIPQEDIPSFSEWAQKQLAEAEKKDTVLNHSSQTSHSSTNISNKNTKIRSKNYASLACGAKIVAVNPEAGSPSSILSPNRDEYMLNTCNSRIWFVVELCEAVQAQKIEIANFELFSSTPKDIAVYFSDRFPTRDWTSVGQFTAEDMRDVQSFDLFPHLFGKFIKVEMVSHHGSEHYCPISLFKVYGTSEFEVLEKESSQHATALDEDEDDEIIDGPDVTVAESEPSKNLFGSARDAVMSIMKKAAQALVKTEVPNKNVSSEHNDTKITPEAEKSVDLVVELDQKEATPKPDTKNGKVEMTTEKPKENGNVMEESDQMIIDNDSFMSELDQMAVDPTPAGSHTQSQNQAQTTLQKESVFLRLSNRVKALERNMSLSGQYLEELSRRYKKQVEEMQKTFEKTVLQMTEERRKSNEREQKYLEQMASLQDQLAQMAATVRILAEERDSWFGNVTFFKFLLFQAIIVGAVIYYIITRRKPEPVLVQISRKSRKKQDKFRRKSVEGVSGHETPSAKKRRPSEEALQIARQSAEETTREDDDEGGWQIAKKNRRRKTSILHRNLEKSEWHRQDSIGKLQENPIPLDEEEFYAPVSEPVEFNGNIENPPKTQAPKTNGSFFNNLKAKTIKTRRLSSPAFLRTLSRQSTRSTPSPVVQPVEPMFNGKIGKKAASESPTGSLWSESTEISQNGSNEGGGKKRKSLKNIFKKVF